MVGQTEMRIHFQMASYAYFAVGLSFRLSGRSDVSTLWTNRVKQDKQYQIPMVVSDEVIRDFGIKQEDVTWRRIGNRKCRLVMVDATEEEYKAYMAPIWQKQGDALDGRCMVKGKNGKLIRCPESNHCEECKHLSETSRERNKPASSPY